MINRVFDRIYVGESQPNTDGSPAFTDETLKEFGVTHVLNVGGVDLSHINTCIYPLHLTDDGENPRWIFSTALGKLEEAIRYGRVLVTCRRGVSRSPFIVLLWLERMGMSREEAYGFLKMRHPQTQISLELLESV